MRSTLGLLTSLACLVAALGCGQADDRGPVASATRNGANAATSPLPTDPRARVAYEFLDAIRRGDTAAANARLTPLALQRTTELDLNFSPPGSPTASFEIGAVEIIEADKAIVESRWTDQDADGNFNQEQIIWALRLSEGQWRISGMAAEIGPDQPDVVIDFENPEALLQQAISPSSTTPAGGGTGPLQADRGGQDPFNQPVQR